MRRIVSGAVLALCSSSSVGAGAGLEAWWLSARFSPTETSIEGIPVAQIDPSWTKALLLNKELLPDEGQAYLDRFVPDGKDLFQRVGDFNADGILDKAVVGVYADDRGRFGRFFLILTQTGTGAWKKAFVSKLGGKPGFSKLVGSKDGATWFFEWGTCFECDYYASEIKWNGKQYVAE